ncbi:hypothetical protein EVAR_80733_1 [Eumeta japonica]|uniref:Uncharacterized protein n=1 Tax=Eumeta variegata TaxID=151549 RepID=A0A4C1U3E8_EUMVA|nr:hypothetical protein EVAR_80733_1 [Eumeta japonica]
MAHSLPSPHNPALSASSLHHQRTPDINYPIPTQEAGNALVTPPESHARLPLDKAMKNVAQNSQFERVKLGNILVKLADEHSAAGCESNPGTIAYFMLIKVAIHCIQAET